MALRCKGGIHIPAFFFSLRQMNDRFVVRAAFGYGVRRWLVGRLLTVVEGQWTNKGIRVS